MFNSGCYDNYFFFVSSSFMVDKKIDADAISRWIGKIIACCQPKNLWNFSLSVGYCQGNLRSENFNEECHLICMKRSEEEVLDSKWLKSILILPNKVWEGQEAHLSEEKKICKLIYLNLQLNHDFVLVCMSGHGLGQKRQKMMKIFGNFVQVCSQTASKSSTSFICFRLSWHKLVCCPKFEKWWKTHVIH